MTRGEFTALLSRWLEEVAGSRSVPERPIVIGMSGAQGSGKTTLMRDVCGQIVERGWRVVTVSIDDFYLTHDEQCALAREYPGNRFLQHRGYPGTHDVAWGVTVLTALRTLEAGSSMDLPGYDRFAFEGTGDRMPGADWRRIDGPVDLVVLEGWMLGFTPVVDPGDPDLRVVNEFLRGYAAWHSRA